MGEILYKTGFGKNRSKKAVFWKRKRLMAVLSLLCLLAGCARKEPEQTEYGVDDLKETPSVETGGEKTPPAEPSTEGNPATEPPIEGKLPAGSQGSSAGGEEQEPPVLTDVLYDKKQLEASKPITIQFLFSDGDSVEKKLDDTFGEVYLIYVDHDDMTDDGKKEVVVQRCIDAAGERYSVLDIFQVEGKEIRQLFPTDDIEGLEGNVCDEDVFRVDRKGRKGYGLHVKIYHEETGQDESGKKVLQMAEEMDLFFEDGKWIRLPERELHVEVSLESDSPEAEVYEAFLKGKCEATLSGQYYSAIKRRDPVPAGRESFYFQEMLDTIASGISEDAALDGMERVECALVDCGSDGRPELAVSAYGVGIWGGRDEGNGEVIMIFCLREGRVELIYSLDCWARSYADIYSNGYVTGGSSAGIMDQYLWYGIIGADGVYRQYSLFIEMEQGLPGMTDYKAVGKETLPAQIYKCTMGDETIYGYYIWEDIPEDVRENVMAYIAENEEKMGVKFLPGEEMDRQLDGWAESLGITEMQEHGLRGIAWQTVGGCEDYLCGQN